MELLSSRFCPTLKEEGSSNYYSPPSLSISGRSRTIQLSYSESTFSISSPQRIRVPPPTLVTATSLPQMLHLYFSPTFSTAISETSFILPPHPVAGFHLLRFQCSTLLRFCQCPKDCVIFAEAVPRFFSMSYSAATPTGITIRK